MLENIFNVYRSLSCLFVTLYSALYSVTHIDILYNEPYNNSIKEVNYISTFMIYYLSLDIAVMLIFKNTNIYRKDLLIHHISTLLTIMYITMNKYDNILLIGLCAEAVSAFNWLSIILKQTSIDLLAQKYKLFILLIRPILWGVINKISYHHDMIIPTFIATSPLLILDIYWARKLLKKLYY